MKLTILDPWRYRPRKQAMLQSICGLVDEEIGELKGMVNLIFCDDTTIQKLNRDYRHKDKVTDVLTFTYYKDSELRTTNYELLGEVLISIPQTKRQAKEFQVTFELELYKLCIHGLLHLRGYDHEKDADYRVMKLLEDKIMKRLLATKKN